MNFTKLSQFYNQVKQEAKNVTYPNKQELTSAFIIVLVVIMVFSAAFLLLDSLIHYIIQLILNA